MQTNLKILVILIFFTAFLITVFGGDGKKYSIGDIGPSGVGKVFYITNGGLHGLEAAPFDQSKSTVWSNINTESIKTTSPEIGKGMANTLAIIAQSGHTLSAAKLCRDYKGGGKNDWFLPSRDEITLLFVNKNFIGNFTGKYYWSSTEGDAFDAWTQDFTKNRRYNSFKSLETYVRAIRAF